MSKGRFEWDEAKDWANRKKHGLSFSEAQYAFADPNRVIARDVEHSDSEERFLLFRSRERRHCDSEIHLSHRRYSNYRSWILA